MGIKLTHEQAACLLRDAASTGVLISLSAKEFIKRAWKITRVKGIMTLSERQSGFYESLRAEVDMAMLDSTPSKDDLDRPECPTGS